MRHNGAKHAIGAVRIATILIAAVVPVVVSTLEALAKDGSSGSTGTATSSGVSGTTSWIDRTFSAIAPSERTAQSALGSLFSRQSSATSIARAPAGESSPAEATSSSSSRPKDSRVFDVSSSPSPVLTSAMKTLLGEPEQIVVPYGTGLAVRLTGTLSSDLNQPGDTFLANLAAPIVIGDRVIVPEGAGVTGRIVAARNARHFSGRSALVIEVTGLDFNGRSHELRSSQYSKQGASRNAYAAAAISTGTGVGAVIGAVIGAALGRGKGAAIGAVLGAAAGTGVQAVTKSAPAFC